MFLFVYGTLRKHGKNHSIIQNEPLIASQAWSSGTIYESENGHPYFILEGPKRVYGEIYEISDEKLREIDQLLNWSGNKSSDEFIREPIEVSTDLLGKVKVETYLNRKEQVNGITPIKYGDWLVHLELERDEHTYYAYGSCMDDARFKLAEVDHLFVDRIGGGITERLQMNYSLSVHDGGRANIIETGKKGEGVLYRVGKEAVKYLLKREGVEDGLYRPAMIDVTVNGKVYEKSLTFIVIDPVDECAPPIHYATEIIRGSRGVVSDEYHNKMVNDLKEKFNLTVTGDD